MIGNMAQWSQFPEGARRDGLEIESAPGDLHLNDVNVTDDPKQVGSVDVVLFAVKQWDSETAGEQTRSLVGSNTGYKQEQR
jgi:2-dehydropantoate 2-reductase